MRELSLFTRADTQPSFSVHYPSVQERGCGHSVALWFRRQSPLNEEFILLSGTTSLNQMKLPVFKYCKFLTLPEYPFHLLQPNTFHLYKNLCCECVCFSGSSDFTCPPRNIPNWEVGECWERRGQGRE